MSIFLRNEKLDSTLHRKVLFDMNKEEINSQKVNEIEKTLEDVREMMRLSTRSHLSGYIPLVCGAVALAGRAVSHLIGGYLLLVALVVLGLALASLFLFTAFDAKKNGAALVFGAKNRRMFMVFGLPMLAGGILCLAMLLSDCYEWMAAVMLLFTGIGTVNLSQHTQSPVRWVGCGYLLFGIVACFLRQYALLWWTLGFGWFNLLSGIALIIGYGGKK